MKGTARRIAKRFGYEVLGPTRAYIAERSLASLLKQENISLVLDVGANVGQFADDLREGGYTGRIVSFEPLAAAHAELRKRAQADAAWTVAERAAVGAEFGSITMYVAGNSVSSSVLPMLGSHADAAPESAYVGTEVVPVVALDDLDLASQADRILLKVDVQGYEPQVLDGAKKLLASCSAVIVEMSLQPLYEGQLLAHDLWARLAAEGFEVWSLEPGFREPATGRMLQMDGVFVRRRMQ